MNISFICEVEFPSKAQVKKKGFDYQLLKGLIFVCTSDGSCLLLWCAVWPSDLTAGDSSVPGRLRNGLVGGEVLVLPSSG